MSGHVRRRVLPSGKVRYYAMIGDKSFGGFEYKRLAEAKLRQLQSANAGIDPADDITFSQWSERWLQSVALRVNPSTLDTYRASITNHLEPRFGDLPLARISPAEIEAFKLELAGKRSTRTVNKELTTLGTILRDAVALDLVLRNPVERVRKLAADRPEMDYFDYEEVSRLLAACEPPLYEMVATAILTGIRQGEQVALRWQDVDLTAGTLRIRQTYHPKHGFGPPKTRAAKRIVFMPGELVEILDQGPAHQLVFPGPGGNPWCSSGLVRDHFHPACDRAGLRRIRWHDLRHTFATLNIAIGENIKYISEQLGHTSIRITLDLYAHVIPAERRDAANRLGHLVLGDNIVPFRANRD